MPLFSQGNLAEISHPDFPGERLVACYNPFLAEDRTRTRNELLDATEASLVKLQKYAAKRTRKPLTDAELGEMIGRRIGRHKMGKHFDWKPENGNFAFSRREDEIAREQSLDGIYVVRTSIPKDAISAEDAVRAYKSLGSVEKAFRTFKGIDVARSSSCVKNTSPAPRGTVRRPFHPPAHLLRGTADVPNQFDTAGASHVERVQTPDPVLR